MNLAELRLHLLENYPESQLELLSEDMKHALLARHPELPADYIQFLCEVGWGTIGDGRYSVYSAPIAPSFVFDPVTAKSLENVVLIGDDFAGGQEAFCFGKMGVVFGSVDGLDGRFEPTDETFSAFIQRWFVAT